MNATNSLFALLVGAVLLIAACGEHRAEAGVEPAAPEAPQAEAAPLKTAILVDQTGSMTWSNTSQVTPESLQPLLDYLRTVSGELALGLIRDRSALGLVRLRIDPAPAATAAPKRTGKAFSDQRAMREYRKLAAEEQRRQAEWEEETNRRVEQFLSQARALLARPASARCTSIWEAVSRADAFLAEDEPQWPKDFARVAILVSDGQHNCGPALSAPPRSQAAWLQVHGAGTAGSLDILKPRRFEGIAAALRYVINGSDR